MCCASQRFACERALCYLCRCTSCSTCWRRSGSPGVRFCPWPSNRSPDLCLSKATLLCLLRAWDYIQQAAGLRVYLLRYAGTQSVARKGPLCLERLQRCRRRALDQASQTSLLEPKAQLFHGHDVSACAAFMMSLLAQRFPSEACSLRAISSKCQWQGGSAVYGEEAARERTQVPANLQQPLQSCLILQHLLCLWHRATALLSVV